MKSTIRGPQCDATSSSTATTSPDLTAGIPAQPGRAATVCWFCEQHFVSASTIRSGAEETTNSEDSWG